MDEKEHRERSKVRRGGIAGDHYRTLKNNGKVLWPLVIFQVVLPFAVGILVLVAQIRVGIIAELITGFTIFGGFLFGLVIYVFQLRAQLGKKSSKQQLASLPGFIDQLFSNVLYAVLVSFALVVLAIAFAVVEPTDKDSVKLGLDPISSAVLALVFTHLLGVIWMCLTRTRRAYLELRKLA